MRWLYSPQLSVTPADIRRREWVAAAWQELARARRARDRGQHTDTVRHFVREARALMRGAVTLFPIA